MPRIGSFLLLCLLVSASLLQTGCGTDAQSKPNDEDDESPSVPIEAATVTTGNIAAYYTGTASLEAEDEALVVARAGGVVEQVFVEEGTYVREGQPLAKLDDARLKLEAGRAQMSLDQLERGLERNEELYAKQLVSDEEYERVKSEYETQQAAVDLALLELEHTTIRAPFSGVVSERMIRLGNMVGQNEPAFRLTDFDPLLAIMHVPERELRTLRTGQPAELRFDALPGAVYSGTIARVSPIVDATTGTFKVTIEVRDPDQSLKPGMFGRVRIVYDTREGTLLIPKAAVQAEDDEAAVYVVQDSMAQRRVVQVGYEDDVHVEVMSGLDEGEVVVITGQSSLRDSTRVEVIN